MSLNKQLGSNASRKPHVHTWFFASMLMAMYGQLQAAPDIELAPRLINEDFGAEQFPGDYNIAVSVGEMGFYPSGSVRLSSIDNLYFQKDDEATSSQQLQVTPKLDLVAEGSKSVFWGLLRGDFRKHDSDTSQADINDFRLRTFGHIDVDHRNRIDLEASISQLSEDLGVGRSRGFVNASAEVSPDLFNLTRFGLTYSYGNPRSRGELVFGVATGRLEIDGEWVADEDPAQYDRDMDIAWGRFSYKLTGKTVLSARLSHKNYEYDYGVRDRAIKNLRLALDWRATGILYGGLSVTKSSWDYESNDLNYKNDDAVELAANLYWAIKSYSMATFYVRQFRDDDTSGSTEMQTTLTAGLGWRHGWSDRMSTALSTYVSEDELANKVTSERRVISVEGRLSLRRWLNFLVGVSVDELSADETDSKRQLVYLGLEGNL